MMRVALILSVILLLGACGDSHTSEVVDSMAKTLTEIKDKVATSAPSAGDISSATTEKLNQLFAIEYRVISLKKDLTSQELQTVLTAAGNERWDCAAPQETPDGIRVVCKRLPVPYLRYILRVF